MTLNFKSVLNFNEKPRPMNRTDNSITLQYFLSCSQLRYEVFDSLRKYFHPLQKLLAMRNEISKKDQ